VVGEEGGMGGERMSRDGSEGDLREQGKREKEERGGGWGGGNGKKRGGKSWKSKVGYRTWGES